MLSEGTQCPPCSGYELETSKTLDKDGLTGVVENICPCGERFGAEYQLKRFIRL